MAVSISEGPEGEVFIPGVLSRKLYCYIQGVNRNCENDRKFGTWIIFLEITSFDLCRFFQNAIIHTHSSAAMGSVVDASVLVAINLSVDLSY